MSDAAADAAVLGIEYVTLSPETVAPFREPPPADMPLDAPLVAGRQSLPIGPGDVLRVQLFEASPEGSLFAGVGGVLEGVVVDSKGYIRLPYAGRIKASGVSPSELQQKIARSLARIAVEPDAFVQVSEDVSNSITVQGAVAGGGRVSMMTGVTSALDAVTAAGNVAGPPWQYDVVLRRGTSVNRSTVSDLMNGSDYRLAPGDRLTVVDAPKRFIAIGAIRSAGAFDFTGPQMSLLDALAVAGGLNDSQADRRGVYLFRPVPEELERGKLFELDMSEPSSPFVASAFNVQPGDAIYVTNALMTDFNKIVDPLIRSISIFRFAIDPVPN